MHKTQSMLLHMMYTAHSGSTGLLKYYAPGGGEKGKKDYGSTSAEYYDYEKVILLEEDADDFNAFDYED